MRPAIASGSVKLQRSLRPPDGAAQKPAESHRPRGALSSDCPGTFNQNLQVNAKNDTLSSINMSNYFKDETLGLPD